MIPAAVATRVATLRPHVEQLLDLLENRLRADLAGVDFISIKGRPKSPDSVFEKLQTGKYSSINELNDLAALTVVVLHRREVAITMEAIKQSGLQIVDEPISELAPSDLRYHEPKLIVKAPVAVADRNPELADLVAEIQVTTALQHALDMTTHDFDYKGRTYSWTNFRLVAQLRGTLELIDGMIDDIEHVDLPSYDGAGVPAEFDFASSVLDVLTRRFDDEALPDDRRRLADTVSAWVSALALKPSDLDQLLESHGDLTGSQSLDPATAVLGALLRTDAPKLLAGFSGLLAISTELESLVPETASVPLARRVALG